MFSIKHSLLIILLIAAPTLALAEENTAASDKFPAFQQLQSFASGLETFSADFEQTILDQNGRAGEVVHGTFSLSRPNLFRWDYSGDFPQQIIGDGSKIWIHDIELEQVSVKAQPQTVAESPALLLLQPETLEEYFVVADMGDHETLALLSLTPKSEDPTFQRLLLGLVDKLPQLLILEDGFGQRTEIRFSQQQLNQPIEAGQFIFIAPPGADIIGDVAVIESQPGQ